jgi:asparagine synthase (glutamine-hydrolysing)
LESCAASPDLRISKRRPDPSRIRDAVETIRHRGPDQQGVFETDTVSLAIARLKIIDLATGTQPFFSPDRDTVIVFNGEVYNHAELRRELEQRGHRFRSHSDTEVVLASFLEWDVECFARFRGMFGLALWTESRGRLVLARDRMGIKPLYVARRGADLYFASELKSIFVHPEIERNLNAAALDCYLSLNYVPAPYTMVDGIEKLRPGHWLEWQAGKTRSEAYWQIPRGVEAKWSLEDAKGKLDSLMQDSVREHLLSDVPLGLWLSSGLDSSSLLHYAAAASSTPLKTLSISFAGRSFDEAGPIRATDGAVRHRPSGVRRQSGERTGGRHRAVRVLFRRAECRWRGAAGVVPVAHDAAACHGGAERGRRRRAVRRIPDLSRRPAGAVGAASAGMGCCGSGRGWILPVSDEKIGFEYKVKRFLRGCLLPANRAHVSGTA